MVLLDMLVVTTALAVMRSHFHVPVSELEWTVSAYTLSYAVLMMTAAAVGDRIGRRRLMSAGLALFAAASAACALVPSLGWLVAARAVQGAGSAMVMPAARSPSWARPSLHKRGLGRSVSSAASRAWPLWAARWSGAP